MVSMVCGASCCRVTEGRLQTPGQGGRYKTRGPCRGKPQTPKAGSVSVVLTACPLFL